MTEAVEVARLRQGLYRFFAEALTHPTCEQLELLRAAADFLNGLGVGDFSYYRAWTRLGEILGSDLDLGELGVDYVRLFESGTDGALCPPTESFYVSQAEGGGIADTVTGVQRTYGALGLGLGLGPEPPDHVSSEMKALSALCGREGDAWTIGDLAEAGRQLAQQYTFLRVHLMAWFPTFFGRVQAAAADSFYGAVTAAAHSYVVHDVDWTCALMQSTGRES